MFYSQDAGKAARMKLQGIYLYSFAKKVYWPTAHTTGILPLEYMAVKTYIINLIRILKVR